MLNLSMTESIRYALDVINTADLILARNLNVRLSIVYGEWWTDVERIDVNEDIEKTLSGVLDYTTGHIYNVKKDNTVFLTGSAFSHKEQASSTFASICTARALSLVKAIDRRQVFETSQLLAQSIGHNFGIDHDSLDCTCDNSNKCVMSKEAGSNGTPFIYGFSKCSQGRMHSALRSGELQCLLNKPFHTSELHHCGNGIVEGNEECDCGSKSREECTDPCCDPITCTLRAHAQCASHQSCCHRCELRKTGHICRTSRSPCDVIEICDGISADCPADGYLIDGTNCDIDGKCWKGDRCIKKDEYFSKKVCIDGSCLPLTKASPPVYCPSNNLALQCSGNKKVYDALNRISEVIDERDTNSMKSRESEHISVHNESSSIYGVGHNRQLPSRGNYVMCDDGTRIRHELSGSQRSLLRMNEPTLALHPNNIFDDTAERFYSQYDRGIRNSPCKSDYGGYTSKMKREPRSDLGYSTRNYEQPYEGIGNLYNDNDLACYSSRYSIQQPPYLPQSYKNISTMSPSSSSYTGSISKLKHTPLKLNNIQTLLKQLDDNDSACLDIRNMDTEESELSNGEHHQDRNSHPDSIPSADLGYSSNATYPCRETFSIAGNSDDGDTFPGRPSFLSERLKVDIPDQF
uniref:Disintegrin domain-containing protein n=1 Tax=Rhabditophanes sp. KR3021 TaxID=114890 RepID=A0AC35UCR6_9BILA